ncbi:MAG: DUF6465 family protein [Clostridiales bacterium]|nr:DUF6465 family protein [Roseburia sp.]MDD7636068.1 DUF6465 family protein [Clostridiales bacterium]MDY4112554.1 DUF6465 family protein [Roseburia sp.]
MEKKMAVKLDGTKATVKAAEEKVVAKAEGVKAAVKEAVAEKKESGVAIAKAVTDEKKADAQKAKETAKKAKTTKSTKTAKKVVKEELKPEVFIQYQGKEAIVADAIEKAKAEFVANGHRVSSIKSLQVYLKPEEYAAYYVINQKFAGRVDLF